MRVRSAGPTDLKAVLAMCSTLWPDMDDSDTEWVSASVAGRPLSTMPLEFILAVDEGDRHVGFIEIGLRSHADGCDARRPVGYVEGWYVDAAHRRRGVGRLLMDAAADWARAKGCTELGSDTWADRIESIDAHIALGFEVVDRVVEFRRTL